MALSTLKFSTSSSTPAQATPKIRAHKTAAATAKMGPYIRDTSLTSTAAQVAHFLNWGAVNHPEAIFSAQVILKEIRGYSRLPRSDSEGIQLIRSSIPAARKLMQANYQRDIVNLSGAGYRATTTSDDQTEHSVLVGQERVAAADRRQAARVDAVDPHGFTATENGRYMKSLYTAAKHDVALRLLKDEDFQTRLLPPAPKTTGGRDYTTTSSATTAATK